LNLDVGFFDIVAGKARAPRSRKKQKGAGRLSGAMSQLIS
jgi:hypothetical protein